MQQITFRAMGSEIMAAIESHDPDAEMLLDEVQGWFAEWEQTLSRFRDDSELNLLNRSAGGAVPVPVSETLWNVLQMAVQAAHYTGGLVVPTLLNSLEAAGYVASFDKMVGLAANAPSAADSPGMEQTITSWSRIRLHSETRSVDLPGGARLDLGGVAKGWAADEAASRLAAHGPALVNAGGDIAIRGPRLDGSDWLIGVDAPNGSAFPEGAQIELLSVRSGGVATSGRDYRRWQQGDQWRHHIIDPRTGAPADTDVISATVLAPTAGIAEIGAKVALLLGSDKGLDWLDERPTLAGLLMLEDGQIVRSERLENHVWSSEGGQ